MTADVHIILLAAGASRRMQGEDKLMRLAGGEPLLQRSLQKACASAAKHVSVVLPGEKPERLEIVNASRACPIFAVNWQDGMGASLAAGIADMKGGDAVIIALADMPDLTVDHYNALIHCFADVPDDVRSQAIIRAASADGTPGHPVLFGSSWFAELGRAQGDQGARGILQREKGIVQHINTPRDGAITDLDTPDAWTTWEARQGKKQQEFPS
ncbi:nucleotidyltransferase family protein [Halocynthiibacter sp.]|uniref:nucleotidyltransferase family protein n=1 Tax=Halocynthiibacter sp. TaxID=1979210 RepID=UPI003C4A1D3A